MPIRGVLFDWRGTLFHDLSDGEWVRTSAEAIGRKLSDSEVEGINESIARVEGDADVEAGRFRADASSEAHRAAMLFHFNKVGLDDELALAVYERDGAIDASFPYPHTRRVLSQLKDKGCRIAVVSDIHYDLRPLFRHHNLDGYINAWALSFEHGWVKPEPEAFLTALRMLKLEAEEALMVGDRTERDGGAVAVGIQTLILPAAADFEERGLDSVLSLVSG